MGSAYSSISTSLLDRSIQYSYCSRKTGYIGIVDQVAMRSVGPKGVLVYAIFTKQKVQTVRPVAMYH